MRSIAIIPARYASTRFPAKPLALLSGKPVIQHVYERVVNALDATVVATDDQRIYDVVEGFGGKAVMTSSDLSSGTERCHAALTAIGIDKYDILVNVQGDEPFITSQQVLSLRDCLLHSTADIATLVKPFSSSDSFETLSNVNTPKVVLNASREALYFSRSIIPFLRGKDREEWLPNHTYYKHIGLYAYRSEVLRQIVNLAPTPLEQAESLEQLRWIENGYRIKCALTDTDTISIDTPEDLERAQQLFR